MEPFSYPNMIDFVCHVCVCGLLIFLRVLTNSPKYFQTFFLYYYYFFLLIRKTGKTLKIDPREIIYKKQKVNRNLFFISFTNRSLQSEKTRDIHLFFLVWFSLSCFFFFLFQFVCFRVLFISDPRPSSINPPTKFPPPPAAPRFYVYTFGPCCRMLSNSFVYGTRRCCQLHNTFHIFGGSNSFQLRWK